MLKKLCFLFALFLLPISAIAHPHVWVDTSLELLTNGENITGLRVNLSFDELYSSSFLQEADANGDNILEDEELEYTVKAVFVDGQEELYPFMYIKPHNQAATFTLHNGKVWMDEDYLRYQFDIVLDTPALIKGAHQLAIFDPEFYVAFEQDLQISLPKGLNCEQHLAENRSISLYYGLVHPETYTLKCS